MGFVQGHAYRIVVGFDFTELGYLALHGAINTAIATPGAELHVLGVVSPGYGLGPVRSSDIDGVDEVQMQIESLVGQALAERSADHVAYYAHARVSGAPAVAIVELANEQSAEFIVVGTHGRHGMDRLMHGSTAEHIVRDANCPVLVMRRKIEQRVADELAPELSERSSLAAGSAVHDWAKTNQ